MSNPRGINRRTICDLCGSVNRPSACEDIRCGWRELPPRKPVHDEAREAGDSNVPAAS